MSRHFTTLGLLVCSGLCLSNNLYGQYSAPSFPTPSTGPSSAPSPTSVPPIQPTPSTQPTHAPAPSYSIPVPKNTRTVPPAHTNRTPPPPPPVQPPPAPMPFYPGVSENPQRPGENDAQEILEVIENQLSAVQAKDYKKAYLDYTAEAMRERTTLDRFIYYVKYYSVLNHNKNALFGNPEYRKNIAILRGTLTGTDGSSYKAEYHLIKEGTQWKVLGLQLIPVTPPITHPQSTPAGANYDFQSDISS